LLLGNLGLWFPNEEQLEPDIITYSGLIKTGAWKDSLSFLASAQLEGLQLDAVCGGSCASSLELASQWRHTLRLLTSLRGPRLEASDGITWNSSISASAKVEMWQEALQLLNALEASPLRASAASFASSVASESSAWRWALRSLRRSELRRIDRTVVAQNSAISACQKGLAWQAALHLLRGMTDHGLVPDATSFSAAISACDWELALALLAEAQKAWRDRALGEL
ncbi:unnamed protein product, partial [Effrenium voratum]